MTLGSLVRQMAVGVCVVVSLVMTPSRAFAQADSVEVSGGYSYLHETELSIPAGWYASGGGYLNSWLGIVGEVNGHYKTLSAAGVDVKTSIHLVGIGPKFALRRNPRIAPYVQVLLGMGRTSVGVNALGDRFDTSINGFAYQPSAGVEFNGGGSVGLRVAVARAAIHAENEWFGETMVMVGVVVRR